MSKGRKPRAAAIYARISQDRYGTELGVQRQLELCRELAERKGWPVAGEYVDNHLSAYRGARRPRYEAMLDAMRAGNVDGVLVVDQDRLTRHPRELEDFIDLADELGVALANVSGDFDLATADGRFRARVLGIVARQESEKKSERMRRQRDQLARQGGWNGGPRPFGYEAGGMTVRPAEAKLMREAVDRVLAGAASWNSIANDWNERGVTTARGNAWSPNAVRAVLSGPRIAGLRQHRGEVVGEGAHPAIIDRVTYERLLSLNRSRKQRHGGRERRLLTGLLECGRDGCGETLMVGWQHGQAYYKCRRIPSRQPRGCQRLSITAQALDDYVRDLVLAALDGPALADAVQRLEAERTATPEGLTEQLVADERALDELSHDFYVDRAITRAMFLRAKSELETRITETRAALATDNRGAILADLVGSGAGTLRERWDAETNEWRRALLEVALERVVILPYVPGKPPRFNPERVEPLWRV